MPLMPRGRAGVTAPLLPQAQAPKVLAQVGRSMFILTKILCREERGVRAIGFLGAVLGSAFAVSAVASDTVVVPFEVVEMTIP
jgi:hypothetical protein